MVNIKNFLKFCMWLLSLVGVVIYSPNLAKANTKESSNVASIQISENFSATQVTLPEVVNHSGKLLTFVHTPEDGKPSATENGAKNNHITPKHESVFTSDNTNTFYLPINKSLILDPAFAVDKDSIAVLQNVYESLVSFDNNGNMRFAGAESYEVSPDGTRYVFHLRQDAKWSDGTPVTAYDFVYTWQRLIDSEFRAPNRHVLINGNILNARAISDGLKSRDQLGIAALSDYELLIVLDKPTPWLLQVLATPATAPIHPPKRNEDGTLTMVTNGAYEFAPDSKNEFLLIRNPNYWDVSNVRIEYIRSYGDKESKENTADKINRSIIYLNKYNENSLSSLYYTQIHTKVYPISIFLELNLKDRTLNKVQVRKALSMLIDRKSLVKNTYASSIPTTLFTPPVVAEAKVLDQNKALLEASATQFNEAKRLLSSVGYSSRNPLIINFVYPLDISPEMNDLNKVVIEHLQNNSQGMVRVFYRPVKAEFYFETLRRGEYQLTSLQFQADYDHASSFYNMLQSQSGDNFAGYDSFQYDRLLSQATRSNDVANREVLYAQANALIEQDVPIIPLIWQADRMVVDKRLRAISFNSFNTYIKDMYFEENTQNQLDHSKDGVGVAGILGQTPVVREQIPVSNIPGVTTQYATTLKKLLKN